MNDQKGTFCEIGIESKAFVLTQFLLDEGCKRWTLTSLGFVFGI